MNLYTTVTILAMRSPCRSLYFTSMTISRSILISICNQGVLIRRSTIPYTQILLYILLLLLLILLLLFNIILPLFNLSIYFPINIIIIIILYIGIDIFGAFMIYIEIYNMMLLRILAVLFVI